jgi:hypothetical protein
MVLPRSRRLAGLEAVRKTVDDQRMATFSVAAWLPLILADFAGTPVADFDVRLIDFDSAHPGDLAGLDPSVEDWIPYRSPPMPTNWC